MTDSHHLSKRPSAGSCSSHSVEAGNRCWRVIFVAKCGLVREKKNVNSFALSLLENQFVP